jgi:hypothetical protein
MSSVMTVAEVAAGAIAATVLKHTVIKQNEIAGLPAELVVAGGLLALGMVTGPGYGKVLLAMAAGAAAAPIANKIAPLAINAISPGAVPAVAGWPSYAIGDLPSGGAMYALPPGAQGAQGYQNLAQVAGLA